MSNEIATKNELSKTELYEVLKSSLYPSASDNSVALVLNYCKATNLDVMQKPVHIVPMWDSKSGSMRDVVMPGIGLYRIQAARSGCAGVSEPVFGDDVTEIIGGVDVTYPKWCKVTVKRKLPDGQIVEFVAMEFWKENYAVRGGKDKSIAPNAMWQKRPYGQIAKCAEAQALRKAFPEVGAMPTAEEMEGKELAEYGNKVEKSEPATPANYPADLFAKNFETWKTYIQNGKKSADDIIKMVETKGKLTDEQRAQIIEVQPTVIDADGVVENAPPINVTADDQDENIPPF